MATATREHARRFRPHRNGRLHAEHGHLQDLAHQTGERAGEYASNIVDRTRDYLDTGREYVVDHPAKSLSMAAGIGILVGMLILALSSRRS